MAHTVKVKEDQAARVMTDLSAELAAASLHATGALWRLTEPGRGLDANLLRLPPGHTIDEHTDARLDVLLIVLEGGGHLRTDAGTQELRPLAAVWLPRGSRRALSAGLDGMSYLSAHPRRPGLTIAPALTEGGDPACLLAQVCPACDRVAGERGARFCWNCGSSLTD
ncbi:cupin domain-containing protein [Streptomyces sp. BR1]|uniref:cupin domain-containing protein n=1 Tax=Streptomyces sp. BR1 TaxID=1592323 RepID=UPI00402B7811